MNTHPAAQSSVPAETKSSAAKTPNSTVRATRPFTKSAFRFTAHLHHICSRRVYCGPPTLLVLDGLDDALAGGGAGGEKTGEDADKEPGEEGREGREFGVVEGDLEAPCAGAEDEEVAEQGTNGHADEAPDEAYDYAFVYDEAPDLEPGGAYGPEDPDLPRAFEDAHGERVDDPEGRHRDRDPHRSEEHTSELQSRQYLVCRLLLEKKKTNRRTHDYTK